MHVVDTNNRPIMCDGCGGQINATCGPFTVSHFGGKLYHPACVQTAMAKADEIAALKKRNDILSARVAILSEQLRAHGITPALG